jgi:hypothetical protein
MDKKPERIYLQWYNEDGDPATEEEEVCWCEDRVYNTDIEYVSAEIVDELQSEAGDLRAHLSDYRTFLRRINNWLRNNPDWDLNNEPPWYAEMQRLMKD